MRHIVLDTETTGFDAENADRIVEIGAIELINYVPSGKFYHQYINPERPIPESASAVHGIRDRDVADKPVYAEIVAAFDEFIGDAPLVIHNAEFDMRFLNAEYKRLGLPALPMSRSIDTLSMYRKMYPGAPASLDALCKRYEVDLSARTVHGALLDAGLLADVFLHLAGGRQLDMLGGSREKDFAREEDQGVGKLWPVREFAVNPEEKAAHDAMVAGIKDSVWSKRD